MKQSKLDKQLKRLAKVVKKIERKYNKKIVGPIKVTEIKTNSTHSKSLYKKQ